MSVWVASSSCSLQVCLRRTMLCFDMNLCVQDDVTSCLMSLSFFSPDVLSGPYASLVTELMRCLAQIVNDFAENCMPSLRSHSNSASRSTCRDVVHSSTFRPLPFGAFVNKRRVPPFVTFKMDSMTGLLRCTLLGQLLINFR